MYRFLQHSKLSFKFPIATFFSKSYTIFRCRFTFPFLKCSTCSQSTLVALPIATPNCWFIFRQSTVTFSRFISTESSLFCRNRFLDSSFSILSHVSLNIFGMFYFICTNLNELFRVFLEVYILQPFSEFRNAGKPFSSGHTFLHDNGGIGWMTICSRCGLVRWVRHALHLLTTFSICLFQNTRSINKVPCPLFACQHSKMRTLYRFHCRRSRPWGYYIGAFSSIDNSIIYWTQKETLQSSLLYYFIKCGYMAFLNPKINVTK